MRDGEEGEEREGSRSSKDRKMNDGEGRKLCRFLGEQGWSILNGDTRRDEEGEWTYTGGGGNSVIDYILGDERTRESVEKMVVEEKVDSDHQPVMVWLKGRRRKGKEIEGRRKKGSYRGLWSEEGKEEFRKRIDVGSWGGGSVEEEWGDMKGELKDRVGRALEGMEEGRRRGDKRGMRNVRIRKRG